MKLISEIEGFENFEGYGITSCGRVWSYKTNRFLTPCPDNKGYYHVCLTDNDGEYHRVRIHRLVALAYISNPNNYLTVDHIDEDKSHNYINNLRWLTNEENISRSHRKPVICIETGTIYESQTAAARDLGLQNSKISLVCNGKRKQTGGYTFKFI